ncbi:unnamed protein product [Penicillium pancosmium]
MGDHATTNDPSNATFEQKGKGKDVQDQIAEDSSDEESDQEPEMSNPLLQEPRTISAWNILQFINRSMTCTNANTNTDEDEDDNNLEPISSENIIQGGRRTRGKVIDYAAEAEKNKDEMEDSEDDEDYQGGANDDDDQMRD